jgi:FAD/FMN-containing dehydrogenase
MESRVTNSVDPNPLQIKALIAECRDIVGGTQVLTEVDDLRRYGSDWTGLYAGLPIAVTRPSAVEQVSELVKLCMAQGVAIVPIGGRTGLCGGGVPVDGAPTLMISLERMNAIRDIDTAARTITVEAGAVLETVQHATRKHGLVFPLMFGAKGSCMIGGNMSTNAGGSNVVRYGNTRELCLGIEAVMPDGTIVTGLQGVRKDNTGYDIKNLLIGAEGTLGIITAAVFKLSPEPIVRATAFLSVSTLAATIDVLNRLQDATGGAVEAFEYMPRAMVDTICRAFPDMRAPLDDPAETGVLIEVASSRADDADMLDDGTVSLQNRVLEILGALMEEGIVIDAMIAQSEQQRADLWTLRESVLEAITENGGYYPLDISLPLAKVAQFVETMDVFCAPLGVQPLTVAHLGDGNLHYCLTAAQGHVFADLPLDAVMQKSFDLLGALGGSFSAEHGIGQSKLDLMRQLKDPGQLAVMRVLKRALDPNNLMNPGKMVPDV